MDIPGAASANSSLTLLGRVTDLVKKGATIELQEAIQSLREALLTEKEEKFALREELVALKRTQDEQNQLVFEYPNYYSISGTGQKDGPFCQICSDTKKMKVRLKTVEQDYWTCGSCDTHFETEAHAKRSSDGWDDALTKISNSDNRWTVD